MVGGVPTEEQLPVMEKLEQAVAQVYRSNRDMTNYNALRAYEAAFNMLRAEKRGHTLKAPEMQGLDAATFAKVNEACRWLLGRGGAAATNPNPISLELLHDCLKRLIKSVHYHTEVGGRQGYVVYINNFIP